MGRKIKKTTEQYQQQLLNDFPEYECLEEYQGNKIKILHRHIKCGYEWKIRPNNILSRQKCPICSRLELSKTESKSTEKYKMDLANKNPEFECLEDYTNNKTAILHKHKVCGYTWKVRPDNILKGIGCPNCRKTIKDGTKEYSELLQEVNPEFEVLEGYVNMSTQILHRHKVCGSVWKTTPSNMLNGCGCRKCIGKQKRSNEDYIKELSETLPDYDVLEEYRGSNIKIRHRHNVCGFEWGIAPSRILRDKCCPLCSGKVRKDTEYYKNELKEKYPEYEVMEEYKNNSTKILHKHISCGLEWMVRPHDILNGYGCPNCASSKGEQKISLFLDSKNIIYEPQKTFDDLFGTGGGNLSYDFYIESKNVLIEFQGIQHYQSVDWFGGEEKFKTQQKHDELKRRYANKNNFSLIEISYLDFDNIEEILTSRLLLQESA